jgi:ABC-type phosphate/phosphonate transport system permease subunit
MQSLYTIVVILAAVALIGSIGASLQQQAFADHPVGGAKQFKDLTHEFEKDVLDAAFDHPDGIPALLEEYSRNVLELFPSTSP